MSRSVETQIPVHFGHPFLGLSEQRLKAQVPCPHRPVHPLQIRAPKAALRYFFRTGIVERACAESAKALGAVSADAEEVVRGRVDWSMCLVELRGPIPQVAHAVSFAPGLPDRVGCVWCVAVMDW